MRSEFEFIQNIKKKYALNHIGDDCAVLPKDDKFDMVITADMLVEDIDFRLDWTTPEFLGHKALAVSLSDIAAMGAKPTWAMLSIGVPKNIWNSDFLDRFYEGWHNLAGEFGVELIGGDISRVPDKIVIDSVVSGDVPKGKAILRSGAIPGDAIFVSGSLGGSAGGLKLLESGISYSYNAKGWQKKLMRQQLTPLPNGSVAEALQILRPTSMIDISDGLSSDLRQLCNTSRVGARIFSEKIPIERRLSGLKVSKSNQIELAINGGEDYVLLFTADKKNISSDRIPRFIHIGEITANVGIIELIDGETTTILEPKGYQHF